MFGKKIFQLCLLSIIVACTVAAKPVYNLITNVTVEAGLVASQVRVISQWNIPSGANLDSVRVIVQFGTNSAQTKQYVGTRTRDTTFFPAQAGTSQTGSVNVISVKAGMNPSQVSTNFGPVTIPVANAPAVTGLTVNADTLP